jgi:hypothetical protein
VKSRQQSQLGATHGQEHRGFRTYERTETRRRGALLISSMVAGHTGGRSIGDPAVAFSRWLRARLRPPDQDRMPGLCRVYNPDGTLREVLDPYTRKPVTP